MLQNVVAPSHLFYDYIYAIFFLLFFVSSHFHCHFNMQILSDKDTDIEVFDLQFANSVIS